MKRYVSIFLYSLLLVGLSLPLLSCSGTTTRDTPAAMSAQAQIEKDAGNFTRATELLAAAKIAYEAVGDKAGAKNCASRIEDMEIIRMTYPHSLPALRVILTQAFPNVAEFERDAWISGGALEKVIIDGQPYYFEDIVTNIKYRNVSLFQQDSDLYKSYKQIYELLLPITVKPADPIAPFSNTVTYQGTGSMTIPLGRLPKTGLFKLWIPVPIVTSTQLNMKIILISPQKYVKQLPTTDQEIGLVYLEVPLEELKEDLSVSLVYTFEHVEQRFAIDPARIGTYDKNGALYKQYTASHGNTIITPEITATANNVAGSETNPYLAAKKLYQFVLDNVKYSHMPHLAMWPRGEPESIYVHRNRFGDCGAQSLYVTALCRSIGIPARTTGGWQLFSGDFGSHFWGEFYLPNYGWIPFDTTAAEMVDYLSSISADDKKRFHDFFFGSQDNLRAVVQLDIDLPLIPAAGEPILFQMAIQQPIALCDTITETNPSMLVGEFWTHKATRLQQ